jgi:hypothetical protein
MSVGNPLGDAELIKAERSRLIELEARARELEGQVQVAQERFGALLAGASDERSVEENDQVAKLLQWAEAESVLIVQDARRRAAELEVGSEASAEDLGRLLLSHFELQERLVSLLSEIAP